MEYIIRKPLYKDIFMTQQATVKSLEASADALQSSVLIEIIKAYTSIRSEETQLAFKILDKFLSLGEAFVDSEIKHKSFTRKKAKKELLQRHDNTKHDEILEKLKEITADLGRLKAHQKNQDDVLSVIVANNANTKSATDPARTEEEALGTSEVVRLSPFLKKRVKQS